MSAAGTTYIYRGTMNAFLDAAQAFLDQGIEPALWEIGETLGRTPQAMAVTAHVLRRKGVITTERRGRQPRGSTAHVTSIIRRLDSAHRPDSPRAVAAAATLLRVKHEALAILREYPDGLDACDLRFLLATRGYTSNATARAFAALNSGPELARRSDGTRRFGWYQLAPRLPLMLGPERAPTRTPGGHRADAYLRPTDKWVLPTKPEATGTPLTQIEIAKIVERLKAEIAPPPEPEPVPDIIVTEMRRTVTVMPTGGRQAMPELARGTAPVRAVDLGELDVALLAELRDLFGAVQNNP